MNATEKANKANELLAAAGIKGKVVIGTNGWAKVTFEVSQNGKRREAEACWSADGTVDRLGKYNYLLPGDLDSQIEKL